MARGNVIVLASAPRGMFLEGTIDDTSKPGTAMEIVPGATNISGRPHWRHYQPSADGDPRMVAILVEDDLQGFPVGTAYVAGKRCRVYVPYPGEEINILFLGQQGTGSADAITVGERLIFGHADGKAIVEGTSSVSAPFMSMEHIDLAADTDGLVWCMRQ